MEKLIQNNLKGIWRKSDPFLSEGKIWYEQAHDYANNLSNIYDKQLFQIAGIISALSPLKEWNLNKRIAKEYLMGNRNIHFTKQVQKADLILNTNDCISINKILRGEKTVNFYNNILNPNDENFVTIDTHIIDCLLFPKAIMTDKRYRLMSQGIKKFAKKVNLKPCEVQAVIWLTHKNTK